MSTGFVLVSPTLVKRREPNHWSVKSNPTLARKREPVHRYAISSPTSAEERKLNCRFANANPALVQRRQSDVDLQPTISIFYRHWWFDVAMQTNNTFWNRSHYYVKYQLNPCQTITTLCIPNDLHFLQTDMVTQYTYMMF